MCHVALLLWSVNVYPVIYCRLCFHHFADDFTHLLTHRIDLSQFIVHTFFHDANNVVETGLNLTN